MKNIFWTASSKTPTKYAVILNINSDITKGLLKATIAMQTVFWKIPELTISYIMQQLQKPVHIATGGIWKPFGHKTSGFLKNVKLVGT
jgi:hypothetical protein